MRSDKWMPGRPPSPPGVDLPHEEWINCYSASFFPRFGRCANGSLDEVSGAKSVEADNAGVSGAGDWEGGGACCTAGTAAGILSLQFGRIELRSKMSTLPL